MGTMKAKQIAKRNTEGGFIPIIPSGDCDICEGQSKGKGITHVVEFRIGFNGWVKTINVCKSCLNDAMNTINKGILED